MIFIYKIVGDEIVVDEHFSIFPLLMPCDGLATCDIKMVWRADQ